MSTTATLAAPLTRRVRQLGTEEAFRFGARIREVEATGRPIIRCNLGQPDFPLPEHIADAVVAALRSGLTTYCDPQGLPELREALAHAIGTSRGVEVDPARVVVFPGGRTPIGLAQHAYLEPGDEVIYPTPSYPLFESFIRYVGGVPVPLPLSEATGFTVRPEDLESRINERTKLIFLNFPSNPTGGVASAEELKSLSEVILERARSDVRVYSDESYEAIVFDGERHRSIASMPGMAPLTIIASGASKTYSWTGGRVGWAVYPTEEEALLHRNLNINYYASLPPYNQLGVKFALESPLSPPIIHAMVEAFQHRRNVVVHALREIDGITCQMPKGAFYVFPNIGGVLERLGALEAFEALETDVRRFSSPATLFQLFLLHEYGVATMDRRSFGILGHEGEHFIRISIATGERDLREAVARIDRASRNVDGFRAFLASGRKLTL